LSASFDLPQQGQEFWAGPTECQPPLSGADAALKPLWDPTTSIKSLIPWSQETTAFQKQVTFV